MLKDTDREKAQSNKTPALTKSKNMGIWVVGISNQLFIRGSLTEAESSKKQSTYWQTPIGPFCTHHSVCLNIGF